MDKRSIPAGSGLLVSVTSGSTLTHFHSDHLGWRVSTNASGQIVGQQGHYPYGESWYSSNGNEFVFTSYQHGPQSGLDYALARNYDSRVPAFGSPDPLPGSVNDPQSWDRYSYVRNDPVDLTDPSGQSWLTDLISFAWGAFFQNHSVGLPGQAPPFGMPGGPSNGTVWNEQSPITGGSTLPGGGVISESGGFGGLTAGFMDNVTGNAPPQDPWGPCVKASGDWNIQRHLTEKSYNEAKTAADATGVPMADVLGIWDREQSLGTDMPGEWTPNPKTGDVGPMQVSTGAARDLGRDAPSNYQTDPSSNFLAGARRIAQLEGSGANGHLYHVPESQIAAAYRKGPNWQKNPKTLGTGTAYQNAFNNRLKVLTDFMNCLEGK